MVDTEADLSGDEALRACTVIDARPAGMSRLPNRDPRRKLAGLRGLSEPHGGGRADVARPIGFGKVGTVAVKNKKAKRKIPLYFEEEREGLREAGRFNAELMDFVRQHMRPGITTLEILGSALVVAGLALNVFGRRLSFGRAPSGNA